MCFIIKSLNIYSVIYLTACYNARHENNVLRLRNLGRVCRNWIDCITIPYPIGRIVKQQAFLLFKMC